MAKNYKKQYISKTTLIIYKNDSFINHFNLMFSQGKLSKIHDELLIIHFGIISIV